MLAAILLETARVLRLQCLWGWHWFWPGLPDVGAFVSGMKAFQRGFYVKGCLQVCVCVLLAGFMAFPLHMVREA